MYARGGGDHSDAYCVQQGGGGGSKNQEKMRIQLMEGPLLTASRPIG